LHAECRHNCGDLRGSGCAGSRRCGSPICPQSHGRRL